MSWLRKSILLLLISLSFNIFGQQCDIPIDFRSWNMKGSPSAVWDVIDSNHVVGSLDATASSYFVSNHEFINVLVKGTIIVKNNTDNDFIGLVFGYKQPTGIADDNFYNFFLFDWKSEPEYGASEGFRLSYYNGLISRSGQQAYMYGTAENLPIRDLILYKYGDDLGWVDNTEYQIELYYTTNLISIKIDDELVFEKEGVFTKGKLGLYCMSQIFVHYKDFTYQEFISFFLSKNTACIDEEIEYYPYNPNTGTMPVFVDSLFWDFGDGYTSTEKLPVHSYNSDGNYNVQLIVYKNGGCSDTLFNDVTVYSDPIVDLGSDIDLPACSSVILEAANPGANYLWSTGQTTESIELINIPTDTTVWVEVEKHGCSGSDTLLISVEEVPIQIYFPNAFTPNNDGRNELFTPVGNTDFVSSFKLTIFNRWGQQIYESLDPETGWDGTCNGSISETGTYVYKVSYRMENCTSSEDYSNITTLTLIR